MVDLHRKRIYRIALPTQLHKTIKNCGDNRSKIFSAFTVRIKKKTDIFTEVHYAQSSESENNDFFDHSQ